MQISSRAATDITYIRRVSVPLTQRNTCYRSHVGMMDTGVPRDRCPQQHVASLLVTYRITLYAVKYAAVTIVKQTMKQEWLKRAVAFVTADCENKRASAERNNAAFKYLLCFIARQLVSLPSGGDLHKLLFPRLCLLQSNDFGV